MGTGIFEQCHFLMGFENTLTALYEHPDEMHELIEYITEYRLKYVQLLIDNLQPDVIFSVCGDIGGVDKFTPAGDIRTDGEPVAVQRRCARSVLGEAYGRAPAIL